MAPLRLNLTAWNVFGTCLFSHLVLVIQFQLTVASRRVVEEDQRLSELLVCCRWAFPHTSISWRSLDVEAAPRTLVFPAVMCVASVSVSSFLPLLPCPPLPLISSSVASGLCRRPRAAPTPQARVFGSGLDFRNTVVPAKPQNLGSGPVSLLHLGTLHFIHLSLGAVLIKLL